MGELAHHCVLSEPFLAFLAVRYLCQRAGLTQHVRQCPHDRHVRCGVPQPVQAGHVAPQQLRGPRSSTSSAGVPMIVIVMRRSPASGVSAIAAPAAAAAIMLWPQACPIPGRASYSAQRHVQVTGASRRGERGRQLAHAEADLKAGPVELLRQQRRSTVLLVPEFGLGVDPVTDADDRVPIPLDGLARGALRRDHFSVLIFSVAHRPSVISSA
jgi:hypothetical protein